MKKNFKTSYFVLFLAFSLKTASSEDFLSKLNFSFLPYLECTVEKQTEEVYTEVDGQNELLSLIEYNKTPSFTTGAKASLEFEGLFLTAGGYYTLPVKSGFVTDSDWMNITLTGQEYTNYQTNYSYHDNYILSDYCFYAELGWTFGKKEKVSIAPFIGADYNYSYYKADDGYYIYGLSIGSTKRGGKPYYAYDDEDSSHIMSGKFYTLSGVLTLERIRYTTWAGFKYNIRPMHNLTIATSFALCPYCYVQSLDSHLQRTPVDYYYDVMSGFLCGVRTNLSAELLLDKHNSLIFNADLSYINVYGLSYGGEDTSAVYLLDSTSGATFYTLNIQFFYRWRYR